jgi:hypothetical protein
MKIKDQDRLMKAVADFLAAEAALPLHPKAETRAAYETALQDLKTVHAEVYEASRE